MPTPSVKLCHASEATIDAALSYWRHIARRPDVLTRVAAYTEIAGIEREIEDRRSLNLWRTGAYPGSSTWCVPMPISDED